jgi:hypothetical protein
MIKGSCLCGGVRFEIEKAAGPFELCHCNRCKKVTGSAFLAGLYVRTKDFRMIAGKELVATFEAPILRDPPPYRTFFCRRCGSPLPNPEPKSATLEIPAGLLDDDPGLKADKHIFVELNAPWLEIRDNLPQYDLKQLIKMRQSEDPD